MYIQLEFQSNSSDTVVLRFIFPPPPTFRVHAVRLLKTDRLQSAQLEHEFAL
jgi:hypothetical protein